MKPYRLVAALALAGAATVSSAGPPYLTDDPVPTDVGHWELYGFAAGEGHRSDLDTDLGMDINYGAMKGVQLTATLPLSFSHDSLDGWRGGSGDVELGVKYRFIDKGKPAFSAAIFPRVILPTAAHSPDEKARLLLPIWLEQDFRGDYSIFGGGGFELNRGPGNRDFLLGAIAVTHDLNKMLSVGSELAWQQPDIVGGTDQLRAGIGATAKLSDHYSLLLSGGPTWADHRTGYHLYAALGAVF